MIINGKELYIPLKIDDQSIKAFEEMFLNIAKNSLNEFQSNVSQTIYLNKKEAAEYIGVSFNTLKKFIDEGLPIIDVSGIQMIRRQDIDVFLESKIK
ncbi:DNA-binding protein [Macrococcus brunensis]|uniref:DNA-binding protein n=1 Tax=Macrococcus brunensis TaxID=198483 RepID=A0A4R6BFB8_9STAP|nr:helix-turn-helix domain-containing protein [Macrococcus brunensis]TDL98524.1 DNA-binding protein [Macrococcus brunensis]